MIDCSKPPGKVLFFEDLKSIYIQIVNEYGKDTYSCVWMKKNGFGWLYEQVVKKYKIKWNTFREDCGVYVVFRRTNLSLQNLIKEYKKVVKKHKEKAYSNEWMRQNGYLWLCQQIAQKHKMKWNEFKKLCGFDSILVKRTLPLESLIKEYKKIVKKYKEEAYSCTWMKKNGYDWLYRQVSNKYRIPWKQFIQMCGFLVSYTWIE